MESSIKQRAHKEEVASRGIVHPEYLENEFNVANENIKKNRNSIKKSINSAFKNRPSINDLATKNIIPKDNEIFLAAQQDQETKSDVDDDDLAGFGGVIDVQTLKSEYFEALKKPLTRERSVEEIVGNMRYIYDVDE
eukprot:259152_1